MPVATSVSKRRPTQSGPPYRALERPSIDLLGDGGIVDTFSSVPVSSSDWFLHRWGQSADTVSAALDGLPSQLSVASLSTIVGSVGHYLQSAGRYLNPGSWIIIVSTFRRPLHPIALALLEPPGPAMHGAIVAGVRGCLGSSQCPGNRDSNRQFDVTGPTNHRLDVSRRF